ncbi:YadA-like family protein [Eikenella corrodens]|uniref:YadA-like family protein n=1 Tax=Eikenella corrodens TaxID=539 RepID=UPI0009BD7D46|nr:YadA-like family protein [Eikenella corrodens]
MNKVYRTVWNEHTNTWVAVQETAKVHGKSGRSSMVAAVVDGISLNKKVLAISASVAAAFMSQTAMADPARIQNGSAQSTIAISPSDSTAGSGSAKATAEGSIAAGRDAKADGKNSISLGSEASTETNSATYYRIKNVPDKTENNIAIGTKARSGGLQTIAFGAESVASKSQSIAFGFDAQATGDQSVALGANTRSMGDSSVAIGGDDLDSVASTVYRATSASADNDAYNDTPLAQKYRELTGQNLVNFTPGNRYIGTSTGQAGVAVGVSAKAADLATAIGTKSHATGDYSVAFGVGANATLANAVALGAGSTTATNATDVPSATIGAITYGSATSPFAGSGKVGAGDQVSVGAAGFERQIKHVAPGAITAASTDAINGSQLFYVAKGLQDQMGAAATHYYSVKGSGATDGNYNNDGATGTHALAAGVGASASGEHAVAVGSDTNAAAKGAIAIGNTANAQGQDAMAIGKASSAAEKDATAVGNTATASKEAATAVGTNAQASANHATSVGTGSKASGGASSAFGNDAKAGGWASVANGRAANAAGASAVAIGEEASAPTSNSIAIGAKASVDVGTATATADSGTVTGVGSVAVGASSSAKGTNAAAFGQKAEAFGQNSLAAGQDSHATGKSSVALGDGARGSKDSATAVGVYTKATGAGATAIGGNAEADTWGATALGLHAKAITNSSTTAIGHAANATGASATAVGAAASATGNNAVAVGNGSKAAGASSFAAGHGAEAGAVNSVSVGLNAGKGASNNIRTIAIGDSAAINSNGNNNVAVGTQAMNGYVGNASIGIGEQAGLESKGQHNTVIGWTAARHLDGDDNIAIGTRANDATAAAPRTVAKTVALGSDTKATVNGAVAVGNKSVASTAAGVEGADPLNAVTAKNNATWTSTEAAVSVGDVTNNITRQITGVAAGKEDTDVVNVAQLKAVASQITTQAVATTPLKVGDGNNGNPAGKVIAPIPADANKLATAGDIANAINNSGFNIDAGGNVVGSHTATTAKPGSTLTLKAGDGLTVKQDLDANGNQSYTYALDAQTVVQNAQTPVVYTKADGTKVYKRPDGKFYDAPTGGNEVAAGDVIASMQDADGSTTAPTTLANVKSNLANTATATGNPNGNDRATLAAGNKGNNAATVNDVLNAGFTVQGNGQDKDFVTHGDTINFVNGQGTVAKVNTTNGVTEVKFDTPMTYVNNAGVPTSDPSNKVNLVGGDTNKPVTLGNVADGNIAAGSKEAINGGQLHDLKENGFKIAADNGTADTVKLTETVTYKGDSNIVTTVTDNQIGFKLADSITVGPATGGNPVKIDGTNGTVTGLTNKTWDPNNITSGRGATEDQLKAAQAAATSKVAAGNGISVTPTVDANTGSTTYTVAADTTALNVGDGNNGNPAGKVITPTGADANKLATAGDIANAINNSGFNIDAGGNVVGSHTATTAKPGSTLTLKAGDGLTVKQDLDANGNQSYTYALDAQTVVQNAQTPVVYTKADGTKVYKRPDGKFYDAPTGGNEVAAGDVIASMQDADGSTTAPTTLANVKSNLANTATATGNPNGNDRATLAAGNKGNNAATVNDVLNAGFTVQGNGQDKDFVTHGDTINFVNGQGTVAKVNTTNGVTEVKFDTPMTYVNNAGVPTSDPSNKVNLVGDAAGGPVTLGNVAPGTLSATSTEAVNGSQLHATNQNVAKGINFGGTTGSNNYQLGDTINVKGDNNITSTTVTGGAQLALNPNLSVTSVTTTDAAGNQTVTNGGGVTITPAGGGNPVSLTTGGLNNGGNKITNVADGTAGTDAVNVGQLNAALGAINSAGNANIAALDAKINDVADTANAGVAQAIATAGLPQAYLPGKNMVAVGGGYYKGETGYAVGFSTISDSGNWIIKATGSGNSRGNFGASIGAGYQW